MPDIIARELFPKNLQRYMADAGLSQTDVARRLGVSKQTVSDWISGKKFPRVDRMQQLADLFSVLMSDLYTDHSDPDPSVLTTGERIKELRLARGWTQEDLGSMIGVKKAAINKYETGIVVNLKRSTLSALARVFGVSPVYFLGSDGDVLSADEQRLVELYRGADERAREDAVRTLVNHQLPDGAGEKDHPTEKIG